MAKSMSYQKAHLALNKVLTLATKRARFFDKALNEVKPEKNTCVSYVLEEGDKGPLAKDLREEDPDRVARVTARVHYGQVVVGYSYYSLTTMFIATNPCQIYKDPPASKPDSGYGFVVENNQLHLEKPKRYVITT